MTRIARAAVLGARRDAGAGARRRRRSPRATASSDYRAPAPATVQWAAGAFDRGKPRRLWRDAAAVFIDTLAQPPRPAGLPAGTIWHPRPRHDIPGSIWLPDTGYGELPAVTEAYFEHGLQQATRGDRTWPVVFYCLADCWMSWNAARRAAALGYTSVEWYSAGTDGWQAAGLPVELREPIPRPAP